MGVVAIYIFEKVYCLTVLVWHGSFLTSCLHLSFVSHPRSRIFLLSLLCIVCPVCTNLFTFVNQFLVLAFLALGSVASLIGTDFWESSHWIVLGTLLTTLPRDSYLDHTNERIMDTHLNSPNLLKWETDNYRKIIPKKSNAIQIACVKRNWWSFLHTCWWGWCRLWLHFTHLCFRLRFCFCFSLPLLWRFLWRRGIFTLWLKMN